MRIFFSHYLEIFKASLKELLRDGGSLFWFFAFPVIFVFIFGLVFTNNEEIAFNIGLILEEPGPLSENIARGIKEIPTFNVFQSEDELTALKKGERNLVIQIPALDYADLNKPEGIKIAVYYDPSKSQTNRMLISAIEQVFNYLEAEITGRTRLFSIESQAVQAEAHSDFDFILPGILAMALMQLGLFGSLQFLTLRENKVIRGLGVTPLSRGTILGSEISVRLIMGIIQTFIILSFARIFFHVKISSNYFQVFAIVILGSLSFISLGYMLISFVRTTEAAQGLIQVIQFPMLFLSGVFFPMELLPAYLQPIVKVFPLAYLGDALRGVMTGLGTMYPLWLDALVLLGWLLVSFIIVVKFWSWD